MRVAKIGKRGVIVIPSEIRKKADLSEGDDLFIDVDDHGGIHLTKKPSDFVKALHGLHQDIWKGVDPVEYVREERHSWKP